MSVIVSSIIKRFCTCCYKPDINHSSEGQVPIDIAQDDPIAIAQVPIRQEELYHVPWKHTENTPVDLKGIDDCDAIVKKPQDIDQPALHSGSSLSSAWEGGASDRPEENVESLPLPWEGIFRRGPVPFDGKSFGPSWREIPVQNIIQEQSESTGDDSFSQKSSKKEMVMARNTLTTDDLAPTTDDGPATSDDKSSRHKMSNVDDDDSEPMKVVGQVANDKDSNATKGSDT